MIRDNNMSCCSPSSEDGKKEYSKSVQIVFNVIQDMFYKIREMDGKDAQESAALKLFEGLGKVTDMTALAEKVLENDKAIKVAEIQADDQNPEMKEGEMDIMDMSMFEELD